MKKQSSFRALLFYAITIHPVIFYHENCMAAPNYAEKVFPSPETAVDELINAVNSDNPDAIYPIFGSKGKDILYSGDISADKIALKTFKHLLTEKRQIEKEEDTRVTLLVGNEDWPFPVPLVKNDKGWKFDIEAGKEEIINRRIGRNELRAIEISNSYVEAQKEYFSVDWDNDGYHEYAQQFLSSPGYRNGLFWPRKDGEPLSPFGPIVANALDDGFNLIKNHANQAPTPYFGYVFRILKSQGSNAAGGKKNYIVNGRMTDGFALLAHPVKWGTSGIMSFLVNQDGIVYQKSLGANTEKAAATIKEFNPDSTWKLVED